MSEDSNEATERHIDREVQRRVASSSRRHHEELAAKNDIIRDCKTKLVQQHSIINAVSGKPLRFGNIIRINTFPNVHAFKSNDEVIVVDEESPHYQQGGEIISGLNDTDVVDDDGYVIVKMHSEVEVRFSVGLEGKDTAQVRLTTKPDGTSAVVSLDGTPWEVKGAPPHLGLQVGEPVKLDPENKHILDRGYELNAGPICTVSALTEKGIEVLHRGEVKLIHNPHDFPLEEGDRVVADPGFFLITDKLKRDARERYKIRSELSLTWDDVGGLELAKDKLRDAIELPFQEPDAFAYYKVETERGVLLYGPPGCGKAQPLDATVYTPFGPKPMGKVLVGDVVCIPDGGEAVVQGVFPQGKVPIFEVRFSDGSRTQCCKEHLWKVEAQNGYKQGILETQELMRHVKMRDGKRVYSIPQSKPVVFRENDHELHPYVMGLLLAEGGLTTNSPTISNCIEEVVERFNRHLPEGYSVKEKAARDDKTSCDFYVTRDKDEFGSYVTSSILTEELDRLGLRGLKSEEKFVPREYLIDSVENRMELIRGLFDGDGEVRSGGASFVYSTSSPRLAEDVRTLVQSMGGTAQISFKHPVYTYKDEKKEGQLSYRIAVCLDGMEQFVTHPEKLSKVKGREKYKIKRMIEEIVFVGVEEAQCILIDHPEHLYLTDDFVVTHNTLLARVAAWAMAQMHGAETRESGYIYVKSPEILDKWVGNTEAEIRNLFQRARKHYREHGYKAILAFDEADAIMPQRGTRRSSDIADTIVPMFLGEMDGIDPEQTKENPIVILMTNRADMLDPAITRPGRISKHIKIDRPDDGNSIDILEIHAKDVPFADEDNKLSTLAVTASDVFSKTRLLYRVNNEHDFTLGDACSGAMLAGIIEESKMLALHRDIEHGTRTGITLEDMREAVNMVARQQRGINHSYDLQDFAEKHGLQPQNINVERCFGAA